MWLGWAVLGGLLCLLLGWLLGWRAGWLIGWRTMRCPELRVKVDGSLRVLALAGKKASQPTTILRESIVRFVRTENKQLRHS